MTADTVAALLDAVQAGSSPRPCALAVVGERGHGRRAAARLAAVLARAGAAADGATAARPTPRTSTTTSRTAATRALDKALQDGRRGGDQGDAGLRPLGPRRRGLPDRPQVGLPAHERAPPQVHHLQRGRGRPRRVREPQPHGERPAPAAGGRDHRRRGDGRPTAASSTSATSTRCCVARMEKAIEDAYAKGLAGKNILGSGFDFEVEVVRGAGSYVCGDETGLLSSLEDRRGMPKIKPPYPAEAGAFAPAVEHQQRGVVRQRPADHAQRRGLVGRTSARRRTRARRCSRSPARSSASACWRCRWARPRAKS